MIKVDEGEELKSQLEDYKADEEDAQDAETPNQAEEEKEKKVSEEEIESINNSSPIEGALQLP